MRSRALLACVARAPVVQRKNIGLRNRRSQVRILPGVPTASREFAVQTAVSTRVEFRGWASVQCSVQWPWSQGGTTWHSVAQRRPGARRNGRGAAACGGPGGAQIAPPRGAKRGVVGRRWRLGTAAGSRPERNASRARQGDAFMPSSRMPQPGPPPPPPPRTSSAPGTGRAPRGTGRLRPARRRRPSSAGCPSAARTARLPALARDEARPLSPMSPDKSVTHVPGCTGGCGAAAAAAGPEFVAMLGSQDKEQRECAVKALRRLGPVAKAAKNEISAYYHALPDDRSGCSARRWRRSPRSRPRHARSCRRSKRCWRSARGLCCRRRYSASKRSRRRWDKSSTPTLSSGCGHSGRSSNCAASRRSRICCRGSQLIASCVNGSLLPTC